MAFFRIGCWVNCWWGSRSASLALNEEDREALSALDDANWWRSPDVVDKIREPFIRAAAWYYVRGRNSRGVPIDAVTVTLSALCPTEEKAIWSPGAAWIL